MVIVYASEGPSMTDIDEKNVWENVSVNPEQDSGSRNWFVQFVSSGDKPPLFIFFILICLMYGSYFALLENHYGKYDQNEAMITGKEVNWEFYEVQHGCGDEVNCLYRTDMRCQADLEVEHTIEGVNYTSKVNNWVVYSTRDSNAAIQKCTDFVNNETLQIGSNVTIFFEVENVQEAHQEIPDLNGWIVFLYLFAMVSLITWLIIMVFSVLKWVAPKNFG